MKRTLFVLSCAALIIGLVDSILTLHYYVKKHITGPNIGQQDVQSVQDATSVYMSRYGILETQPDKFTPVDYVRDNEYNQQDAASIRQVEPIGGKSPVENRITGKKNYFYTAVHKTMLRDSVEAAEDLQNEVDKHNYTPSNRNKQVEANIVVCNCGCNLENCNCQQCPNVNRIGSNACKCGCGLNGCDCRNCPVQNNNNVGSVNNKVYNTPQSVNNQVDTYVPFDYNLPVGTPQDYCSGSNCAGGNCSTGNCANYSTGSNGTIYYGETMYYGRPRLFGRRRLFGGGGCF